MEVAQREIVALVELGVGEKAQNLDFTDLV